jgi:ATP diphosphatase
MTSAAALERLLCIMQRLRDPQLGCEWDRAQTFETIAPYTVEEAYEVADAIERQDLVALREELGDLLLQVVFHSQIADELGAFDFVAVANTIADKMEARHPHIFGDGTGSMNSARWEDLKAAERGAKGQSSTMDGVANALPALMRAQKLQARAARDGFDWPDLQGPLDKLTEEIDEFTSASDDEAKLEEAGDLLFAAVNVLRAQKIDPETALQAANRKFERRYRAMERLAGDSFAQLTLEQQEALWCQVKEAE